MVLAAYAVYLTAFAANDMRAVGSLVQYPLVYIGASGTALVDA